MQNEVGPFLTLLHMQKLTSGSKELNVGTKNIFNYSHGCNVATHGDTSQAYHPCQHWLSIFINWAHADDAILIRICKV